MLPNVVIAGAPKCGTTSLFAWLATHPEVCGSNTKETRYLVDPEDPLFKEKSNYRDHGLAGYEAYFEECSPERKVILEATPVYLYQRTALEVLAGLDPHLDIVLVFRKPSERVYSHFHFLRDSKVRIETGLSFAEFVRLVKAQDPRITSRGHAKNVLDHSRYADYVPAWLERFPRERLHFFLFEDLRRDPRAFARGVAAELGIEPAFFDSYAFPRKNTTFSVRRPWLHQARRAVGRRLPPGTRKRLKAATASAYSRVNVQAVSRTRSATDTDTLLALDREFEPYDEKLAELTGLDLTAWR
jgi:Sulfotransferase domain